MHNPYAPPTSDGAPATSDEPTRAPRSAIPRVLGVLSIVFSGIVLLFGGAMLVSGIAFYQQTKRLPGKDLETKKLETKKREQPAARQAEQTPREGGREGTLAARNEPAARAKPEASQGVEAVLWIVGPLLLGATFVLGTPALLVLGIGQVRYRRWSYRFTLIWSWSALAGLILSGVMLGIVNANRVASSLSMLLWLPYPIVMLSLITRPGARAALSGGAPSPRASARPAA